MHSLKMHARQALLDVYRGNDEMPSSPYSIIIDTMRFFPKLFLHAFPMREVVDGVVTGVALRRKL